MGLDSSGLEVGILSSLFVQLQPVVAVVIRNTGTCSFSALCEDSLSWSLAN